MEIEMALRKDSAVDEIIPTLVDDAAIPDPSELPHSMRRLLEWESAQLRSKRWGDDVESLIAQRPQEGRRRTARTATSRQAARTTAHAPTQEWRPQTPRRRLRRAWLAG